MTDQTDPTQPDGQAADAQPATIVGGNPDAIETQALNAVIAELAAEAKAQRATEPRRGTWGLTEGPVQIESRGPRGFTAPRHEA